MTTPPASLTVPVTLPALPDVADHAIAGKATMPAVDLLELLVRAAANERGWTALPLPFAMRDVAFPRFLPAEEVPRCTFDVTLETRGKATRATLTSRIALAGGMRRARVHAQAELASAAGPPIPVPPAFACDFEVPAQRIYRELIPFGPRYRNLREDVGLSPAGAVGLLRSPEPPRTPPPLASCPYLLDAAMHLACVWGQRHAGYVAYPTGFAARVLLDPLPAGQRRCVMVPRSVEARRLLCDLWLTDEQGRPGDVVTGLAMSPLASGAPPPAWITLGQERA